MFSTKPSLLWTMKHAHITLYVPKRVFLYKHSLRSITDHVILYLSKCSESKIMGKNNFFRVNLLSIKFILVRAFVVKPFCTVYRIITGCRWNWFKDTSIGQLISHIWWLIALCWNRFLKVHIGISSIARIIFDFLWFWWGEMHGKVVNR